MRRGLHTLSLLGSTMQGLASFTSTCVPTPRTAPPPPPYGLLTSSPLLHGGLSPFPRLLPRPACCTQGKLGNKWTAVAQHVPGKTGQQCAQRWRQQQVGARPGAVLHPRGMVSLRPTHLVPPPPAPPWGTLGGEGGPTRGRASPHAEIVRVAVCGAAHNRR